jgi:hypothetical protein
MSITDTTYFVADINLPIGTYNTITEESARLEKEILELLLGYGLAKLVIAYSGSSEQRIKDIVEGKEYTEGDYTIKWNGLKNSDLKSILSYYIYIHYLKNNAVTFQNTGAVAPISEGGAMVSVAGLIQRAGYRLRELAGYPGQDLYAPSLYNFLLKYESTYPEWQWTEYKPYNAFGI